MNEWMDERALLAAPFVVDSKTDFRLVIMVCCLACLAGWLGGWGGWVAGWLASSALFFKCCQSVSIRMRPAQVVAFPFSGSCLALGFLVLKVFCFCFVFSLAKKKNKDKAAGTSQL